MSIIHRLKTWPTPFEDVKYGRKPFEIRKNDRNYSVGDFLVLDAWNPETRQYVREEPLVRMVTYVMHGGRFGLAEDHVALGIDCLADEKVSRVLLDVAPPRPTEPGSGDPR